MTRRPRNRLPRNIEVWSLCRSASHSRHGGQQFLCVAVTVGSVTVSTILAEVESGGHANEGLHLLEALHRVHHLIARSVLRDHQPTRSSCQSLGRMYSCATFAAFLAKSLVALRLPPKNRTLPWTSRSSNDSPFVLVNRQWTVMEVAPATVVT
jgi:hypothetical protein